MLRAASPLLVAQCTKLVAYVVAMSSLAEESAGLALLSLSESPIEMHSRSSTLSSRTNSIEERK